MGVSIHAYSKMRLTEPHKWSENCSDADHCEAYVLDGFEQSLRGLSDWRCYEPTAETDQLRVMDNSYGGHNRWREALCQLLYGFGPETIWRDPDKYRHLPCFELIHFADNEGCIGPEAAADLLDDFVQFADPLAVLDGYEDGSRGSSWRRTTGSWSSDDHHAPDPARRLPALRLDTGPGRPRQYRRAGRQAHQGGRACDVLRGESGGAAVSRPESELSRADHLATLLVRQHAEQIMADLPREEEWATAQRRDDLAEDVRLWARKRKRDRINREAARRAERQSA